MRIQSSKVERQSEFRLSDGLLVRDQNATQGSLQEGQHICTSAGPSVQGLSRLSQTYGYSCGVASRRITCRLLTMLAVGRPDCSMSADSLGALRLVCQSQRARKWRVETGLRILHLPLSHRRMAPLYEHSQ